MRTFPGRRPALLAAVGLVLLVLGAPTSASAGPAPASWSALDSRWGVNGLLDLAPAAPEDRSVSGDITSLGSTTYVARTEFAGTGSRVVVEALDVAGRRLPDFGVSGRITVGGPSDESIEAVTLRGTERGQLLLLSEFLGSGGSGLTVTLLDAATGALVSTFGTGGRVVVPGAWDGVTAEWGGVGHLLLVGHDVSGDVPRGVVMRFTDAGVPDLGFGGGDGRIDSPLGIGTSQEQLRSASLHNLIAVAGVVDGRGVVALYDREGSLTTTFGTDGRRELGDRVDGIVMSGSRVIAAVVSGRTGTLQTLSETGATEAVITSVAAGCDVGFPDIEPGLLLLVDDGCGRGARIERYDVTHDGISLLPRAAIAPELDTLRPVVVREVARSECGTVLLGARRDDSSGATVACVGIGAPRTGFAPVEPARVLDTRNGTGAAKAAVGRGGTVVLDVTGVGGVPAADVQAVTLNVTAVAPTATGHVSVYPSGTLRPAASNINTQRGVTTANQVVAKVGQDGKVVLHNSTGTVHLVADVAGYFSDVYAGGHYTPASPLRVLDTRDGTGARRGVVSPQGTVRLDLRAAGVPLGASTAVLNVTAVAPSQDGYVTAYPGPHRPLASHVNTRRGITVPNLVTVKLADDGSVTLYNSRGTVHLVADLAGWFHLGADDQFVPLAPLRMLDTRSGTGTAAPGAVGPRSSILVPVADAAGVPPGATAVVLNVIGINPSSPTHVTAHPATAPLPTVSNLNLRPGVTQANLVVVKLGSDGNVRLYNSTGSTHLVADVAGYFVLDPHRLA